MIEHRKFLVLASQGKERRNPDAYRKSPRGEGKARRTKIVSISCFQDIYSRNSSDERTVGLPVNPSEFRALECRRAPSDFAGRGKHSKATRMKNGLTVRILRTRPSECDVDFLRAVAETPFSTARDVTHVHAPTETACRHTGWPAAVLSPARTQISGHCPFSSGQVDCVTGTAASSAGMVATRSYRSQGPRL
jgi:hypothetical protein